MSLKKIRRIAGLTQVELAREAGCSQALISDLESGKYDGKDISHRLAVCIARALRVEPDEIFPVECPELRR